MQIEVNTEEMMKFARSLLPKLADRPELFHKIWQAVISYAQFGNRDFINNMIHYERAKPDLKPAYLAEAKAHIADCFTQLILLCLLFGIDINEVIKFGEERLKNHAIQEMFKEFGIS